MAFNDLLQTPVLGSSLESWLIAALAFVLTAVGVRWLLRLAIARLRRLSQRSRTGIDDAAVDIVARTQWWVLVVLGLYAGGHFLTLPASVNRGLGSLAAVVLIVQAGIWVSALLASSLQRARERRLATSPAAATGLNAIGFVGRLLIWAVVVLIALDNLGVDVTALVAGLGVGGVAVALAVQNILGDLFASLSIVFDKPFSVGDFLVIDAYMGSVENVGLKTTRLRSLSGEQLVLSNSDLLGSRIRNYGRMYERRVVFNIGVTYQTPRNSLRTIPQILREAIESQPKTRFDRSHFKEYGDSALIFETVYYVLMADYNVYMDIQQAINLYVHERFEALGVEFAYPTRTVLLRQEA